MVTHSASGCLLCLSCRVALPFLTRNTVQEISWKTLIVVVVAKCAICLTFVDGAKVISCGQTSFVGSTGGHFLQSELRGRGDEEDVKVQAGCGGERVPMTVQREREREGEGEGERCLPLYLMTLLVGSHFLGKPDAAW